MLGNAADEALFEAAWHRQDLKEKVDTTLKNVVGATSSQSTNTNLDNNVQSHHVPPIQSQPLWLTIEPVFIIILMVKRFIQYQYTGTIHVTTAIVHPHGSSAPLVHVRLRVFESS
jgi:hypothetical protein